MKIALIQISANEDKAKNIAKAVSFVKNAVGKKSQCIALPEVFSFRGDLRNRDTLKAIAEHVEGETVSVFKELAKVNRAWIILGSIIEKAADNKFYNTCIVINSQGKIAAKYRKIHLFDARLGDKIIRESACFKAGNKTQVVGIEGFRTGLSICYDLRFSNIYQAYKKAKVDAIVVPACFTKKTGQAHWEVLLRARAIENLAYVIAPNQVGPDYRGVESFGHSMIVDPWGRILAQGSLDKEEIVYAEIFQDVIEESRRILPGIV